MWVLLIPAKMAFADDDNVYQLPVPALHADAKGQLHVSPTVLCCFLSVGNLHRRWQSEGEDQGSHKKGFPPCFFRWQPVIKQSLSSAQLPSVSSTALKELIILSGHCLLSFKWTCFPKVTLMCDCVFLKNKTTSNTSFQFEIIIVFVSVSNCENRREGIKRAINFTWINLSSYEGVFSLYSPCGIELYISS